MPDSRPGQSRNELERLLAILAGLVLIGAGVFAFFNMPAWSARFWTPSILCACGCVCMASGYHVRSRTFTDAVAKFSLIVLTLAAMLALGELTLRAIHYDFSRSNK